MAIVAPMLLRPYNYREQLLGLYNTAPSTSPLVWNRRFRTRSICSCMGRCTNFIIYWVNSGYYRFNHRCLMGKIVRIMACWTENIMMRIADILYAVPYLLVVIILLVVMEKGILPMIIALSITGWINMARIVRGEVLSIKNQEYVLAARTLGANTWHLIVKHLIPNAFGAILVTMTLTIPTAIFTESFFKLFRIGCSSIQMLVGERWLQKEIKH